MGINYTQPTYLMYKRVYEYDYIHYKCVDMFKNILITCKHILNMFFWLRLNDASMPHQKFL